MDNTERFIDEELKRESERIEREINLSKHAVPEKTYDEILTRIHNHIENGSALQDDSGMIFLDELDRCKTLDEAARLRDVYCQRIIDRYRKAVDRLTTDER